MNRSVVVHRSPDALAGAVAARLLTRLVDIQSAGRRARIVLTGGTIADLVHRAVAASPARSGVDWGRVEVWWGDERFVDSDSPDRNERQARSALLDALPFDPALVHPMPAPDRFGPDLDLAAEQYANELAAATEPGDHDDIPTFDIVMLGVGPDGHVASLFPGQPALYDERPVVGVRASPKPPPLRITLTMGTLCRTHDVWFMVSGAEKARAVHLALGGAGSVQVPAAGPHGLNATLWLLDRAAAAELPPELPVSR